MHCSVSLHCITLPYCALHCTIMHCTTLHCIVFTPHCIALLCTTLHFNVLYCAGQSTTLHHSIIACSSVQHHFCGYCLHGGEATMSSYWVNECNNRMRTWPDIFRSLFSFGSEYLWWRNAYRRCNCWCWSILWFLFIYHTALKAFVTP